MGFAQFILKIEADSKGVGSGVNTAISNIRRLSSTNTALTRRAIADEKQRREEAFRRLSPEQQINKLLSARELIQTRLSNLENSRLRQSYLLKQMEIEKQMLDIESKRSKVQSSGPKSIDIGNLLNQIPGYGRIASILGAFKGYGGVAASGAAAYGIGKTVNSAATRADQIQDLQSTTGFSASGIQKLQYGATATKVDFDSLVNSATTVRRNQSKALEGDTGMIENFNRLGYSIEKLRQLSPEELFFQLGQQLEDGNISATNFNAVMEILGGKTGEAAKVAIQAFSNNLVGLTKEFENAGGVIGDSTINALADFKAEMNAVQARGEGFLNWVGSSFATGFIRFGKRISAFSGFISGDVSLDQLGEQNAAADLIGDSDYDASLAKTRQLEKTLKDKKDAKYQSSKEDFEDFNYEFDHADKKGKKKAGEKLNSPNFGALDVDKLARIGLFIGGTSPQFEVLKNQLRELSDTRRAVQSMDRKLE